MIKPLQFVIAFVALSLSSAFAGTPSENAANNNNGYKSPDEEVIFKLERSAGEVKLHVSIKDVALLDHVVIEKSLESLDYFGDCKYISCIAPKLSGIFNETDKYPYSATKDVYYRVKTVTKDGIERAYAPILLPAIR